MKTVLVFALIALALTVAFFSPGVLEGAPSVRDEIQEAAKKKGAEALESGATRLREGSKAAGKKAGEARAIIKKNARAAGAEASKLAGSK